MSSKQRDTLRGKILATQKAKSVQCAFNGGTIEVRQPSLGEVFDLESSSKPAEQAVDMLIKYCYVPGTDEHVFEPADRAVLLAMPFGEDFVAVQTAIAKLTGVDLVKARKNSEKTSGNTTS